MLDAQASSPTISNPRCAHFLRANDRWITGALRIRFGTRRATSGEGNSQIFQLDGKPNTFAANDNIYLLYKDFLTCIGVFSHPKTR
jgi:hypothetical protein